MIYDWRLMIVRQQSGLEQGGSTDVFVEGLLKPSD